MYAKLDELRRASDYDLRKQRTVTPRVFLGDYDNRRPPADLQLYPCMIKEGYRYAENVRIFKKDPPGFGTNLDGEDPATDEERSVIEDE